MQQPSGGIGSGMMRLFMTHPPLEERIAARQVERSDKLVISRNVP